MRSNGPEAHHDRVAQSEWRMVLETPGHRMFRVNPLFILVQHALRPDRQSAIPSVTALLARLEDVGQRKPDGLHEPLDRSDDPVSLHLDVRVGAHVRFNDELLLQSRDRALGLIARRDDRSRLELLLDIEELDPERR